MIKIAFSGFWPTFNTRNNFLLDAMLLSGVAYKVVRNPVGADVVFHSHFKSLYEKILFKKCLKNKINIFFSGEATEFDPNMYSATISSRKYVQGNHYRLPLWKIYINYNADQDRALSENSVPKWYLENSVNNLESRKNNASAVFSNMNSVRRYLIDNLRRCGPVDLYGKHGLPLSDKMQILPMYKFNLCPENAIVPGYITEKIIHAKACGCIPIWYGDVDYQSDFNKESLINILEFNMDAETMMDCADFKRVAETPLVNEAMDYRPELASFLLRTIL